MDSETQFCLRWNNFGSSLASALQVLQSKEDFVDVTLIAENTALKAHKVILSACSPYFEKIFKLNPCPHPVIILKDSSSEDLESLLAFVYEGKVNVLPTRLNSFMGLAESLHIKGLTEQIDSQRGPDTQPSRKASQSFNSQFVDPCRKRQKSVNDESSSIAVHSLATDCAEMAKNGFKRARIVECNSEVPKASSERRVDVIECKEAETSSKSDLRGSSRMKACTEVQHPASTPSNIPPNPNTVVSSDALSTILKSHSSNNPPSNVKVKTVPSSRYNAVAFQSHSSRNLHVASYGNVAQTPIIYTSGNLSSFSTLPTITNQTYVTDSCTKQPVESYSLRPLAYSNSVISQPMQSSVYVDSKVNVVATSDKSESQGLSAKQAEVSKQPVSLSIPVINKIALTIPAPEYEHIATISNNLAGSVQRQQPSLSSADSTEISAKDNASSSNTIATPDTPTSGIDQENKMKLPDFCQDRQCFSLPYPCPFCDKSYTSWGFRRRHIKGFHTKTNLLPCKWCYTVLNSHTQWEEHVTSEHRVSPNDAKNGILILEEAHMVLQIAQPTRIESLMELIKEKKKGTNTQKETDDDQRGDEGKYNKN